MTRRKLTLVSAARGTRKDGTRAHRSVFAYLPVDEDGNVHPTQEIMEKVGRKASNGCTPTGCVGCASMCFSTDLRHPVNRY